jgi:hypothetical protein
MTDKEWLQGTDPAPLFHFVSDFASDRKLRLFACACCRHVWPLLPEDGRERSRYLLDVTERYADGLAREGEVLALWEGPVPNLPPPMRAPDAALRAVSDAIGFVGYGANLSLAGGGMLAKAARSARSYAVDAVRAAGGNDARAAEWRYQAELLRELFGNPFRPPKIEAAWLAWHDGFIPELAKLIYEERAFDRLPILGDALEDAGCDDPSILDHCRLPGDHVRGCWVVDRLLGKE